MAVHPVRVLSLCSGIGGLDIGVDIALGGRCKHVALVEREAFSVSHLVAAMEAGVLAHAPIWSDVASFPGRKVRGRVDLVVGGYPCQPFSHAGQRRGADDPRHLWPHIRRLLVDTDAPLAFFENVRGHVSLGLQEVLADLASLGFDAEWGVFRASDVGATHQRARLFILAWRHDLENAGSQSVRRVCGQTCGEYWVETLRQGNKPQRAVRVAAAGGDT